MPVTHRRGSWRQLGARDGKSKTPLSLMRHASHHDGGVGAPGMDRLQVHYELFVRHTPGAPWTLEMASETPRPGGRDRRRPDGREAASPRSGSARRSLDRRHPRVQERHHPLQGQDRDRRARRSAVENREPLCVTPAGSLHRPRPRPHRPAARRLADPQPRHRRSSCCTAPTWSRSWTPPATSCSTRSRRSPCPRRRRAASRCTS